jgi:20S proteasome alpha/beta subunit
MTVIAGFKCTDGIVLCSDSQYTYGSAYKGRGAKLAFSRPTKEYTIMAAVAGSPYSAQYFFDEAVDQIDASDKKLETIREVLRENLYRLHHEHIYPAPADIRESLESTFLIGLWVPEAKPRFFKTEETMLLNVDAFECGGSGFWAARQVAEPILASTNRITTAQAELLSALIVRRAKAADPHCGFETMIWALDSDSGKVLESKAARIDRIEDYLSALDTALAPLILHAEPEKISENRVESLLTNFASQIRHASNKLGGRSGRP